MGHHFDSPTSIEDPRIDPTDLFVFPGAAGTTVFVLNVNPDAGRNAPAEFRDETLYEVRVDLDLDRDREVAEDLALQARFAPADPGTGVQSVTVTMARGAAAGRTEPGQQVAAGVTGEVLELSGGGRAWAGRAADPFSANFFGHGAFVGGLLRDGAFRPEVFADESLHRGHPADSFAERNVMSLVFEVPDALLGAAGTIGAWGVVSLYGHAPTQQVARMAHPVIVFYFGAAQDPDKLTWLRGHPRDDRAVFGEAAAGFVAKAAAAAGRVADPGGYGRTVAEMFLPDVLPYRVGTAASYGYAGRNGRALTDDVLDVQLSTITGAPVDDHILNARRVRPDFPHVGEPWPTRHAETLYGATH